MNPQGQFLTRSATARRLESELQRYSLSKVIRHIQNEEPLDGFEGEVEREFGGGQGSGNAFGKTVTVPWGALAPSHRGLNTSIPVAGGNLVGMSVGPAADVLRPYSVVARCGMSVLSDLAAGLMIPAVDEEISFSWLSTEGAPGAVATPRTGVSLLTPKIAIGLISYSGKLLRVGSPKVIEAFVKRRLLQAAGQLIDTAVLSGRFGRIDAPANESAGPLGLCSIEGLMRETATGGDEVLHKTARAMTLVANRAGSDDLAAFIVSPMFREHLLQLRHANGIEVSNELNGRALHCSSGMPALMGAYGEWSNAILALFGAGVELQIDPFTGFKNDVITMRCLVPMDVAFPNPGAFALIDFTAL